MIIDKRDAEILVKTPTIKRMPPIVSARAIGICNSAGSPNGPVRKFTKPGANLPDPATIKIVPIVARRPKNAISCNLFSRKTASVNNEPTRHFPLKSY